MNHEIRPKIVCKNLEDIIKEKLFTTKPTNLEESSKKQESERTLKSYSKKVIASGRCNTSNDRPNKLIDIHSMSKHSLPSKQKMNFLNLKESQNNSRNSVMLGTRNRNNSLSKDSVKQFQRAQKQLSRTSTSVLAHISPLHTKSLHFNQIDALLTDLEDFIRQSRQKVCEKLDFLNQSVLISSLINILVESSNSFKQKIYKILQTVLSQQLKQQIFKKNSNLTHDDQENFAAVQEVNRIATDFSTFSQLSMSKIENLVKRQNTASSMVNSEQQEDSYPPAETDLELLSMLAYKNKANNTKRKLQNTFSYCQEHFGSRLQSERGPYDSAEDEYSFRNKSKMQPIKQSAISLYNNLGQLTSKKKNNLHSATLKSQNKENREKSVYEIVLEGKRKSKPVACY